MYIDDCLRSLHEMMIAPSEKLSCRVYNVAAMSFTPEMIYNEVKKHVPNLAMEYQIDDRQKIGKVLLVFETLSFSWKLTFSADEWPQVFDDSQARKDWGWQHDYNLEQLVDIMISNLKRIYRVWDDLDILKCC